MRAVYTGHEALTFTDYTDLETGKTLHAEPGETYDIAPASGRLVPDIPVPWFAGAQPAASLPMASAPALLPSPPQPDPPAAE